MFPGDVVSPKILTSDQLGLSTVITDHCSLSNAPFEHVKNGLVEPRDANITAIDKTEF